VAYFENDSGLIDHLSAEIRISDPMECDDCEIFVLLGRELLGWGKVPPDISQFAVFYRQEGDSYVEQFPWAELGVAALPPGKPDPDNMRYFTQPEYTDNGLTAVAHFVTSLVARDERGRALPPYMNSVILDAQKDRWALDSRIPTTGATHLKADPVGGLFHLNTSSVSDCTAGSFLRPSRSTDAWEVSEKSRPGVTPDGFLIRLPARQCSGSAASMRNADATW
jgi:hypothetical protein